MYEEILYEVDGPSAVITLNRPAQLNAWTDRMHDEVRHAIAAAEDDTAVVGIILTGAGRAFCAGADMGNLQAISDGERLGSESVLDADPGDADIGYGYRDTYNYLASVRKPVIAAINGACAGMAVPISLFCDMRFGSDKAMMMTAFAKRGLIAEWGSAWMLPRMIGTGNALDMLMSSRKVRADELLRMGILSRVVEGDGLLAQCKAYVQDLADGCSPESLAVMKRQVYQQLQRPLEESTQDTHKLMVESFKRPDFKEGVASFVEKRPPRFARIGKS